VFWRQAQGHNRDTGARHWRLNTAGFPGTRLMAWSVRQLSRSGGATVIGSVFGRATDIRSETERRDP